jgi:hypothetical protein
MASAPTDLADLATRGMVATATLGTAARERTVPLLPVFGTLLPQAVVQRGSVVSCRGSAAVSLACAVVAGASSAGAWAGVAGFGATGKLTFGLAAAAELGVSLDRVVAVGEPVGAPLTDGQWGDVVASLIDGFDMVVLGPLAQRVRAGTARRLVARAQARGAVLVAVEAPVFGADLLLEARHSRWQGLGSGHGVAAGRVVEVSLTGRRVPQQRQAQWWLPAPDGQVRVVEVEHRPQAAPGVPVAPVVPLRRAG